MKITNASRPPNAVRRATADDRPGGYREKLLQVGAKLFVNRGITQVSVEQLVSHAEVSRATFYGFFENKNELAAAILLPVFESGVETFPELVRVTAREAATQLIDVYLALWKEHRDALLLTASFNRAAFAYIKARHDAFNSGLKSVLNNIESAGLLRNDSADLTLGVIAKTAVPLLHVYKDSDDLERCYRESMLALLYKS
jgi:AcrR family transcriptional regulator